MAFLGLVDPAAEEEEGAGKGEEGGKGGNKGKPYKFKLLCSSDGSVLLKEEDGRIYFSASGKMPEAGDGLEYEKQQNGEGDGSRHGKQDGQSAYCPRPGFVAAACGRAGRCAGHASASGVRGRARLPPMDYVTGLVAVRSACSGIASDAAALG